jgi:hypothetical protein
VLREHVYTCRARRLLRKHWHGRQRDHEDPPEAFHIDTITGDQEISEGFTGDQEIKRVLTGDQEFRRLLLEEVSPDLLTSCISKKRSPDLLTSCISKKGSPDLLTSCSLGTTSPDLLTSC